MKYLRLSRNSYALGEYSLQTIRKQDIMWIKNWRNEQIRILRQKKVLADEDQINYYTNIIEPSFIMDEPRVMVFSFLLGDQCIGYGGLTNIDWDSKRAECSFLLATDRLTDSVRYCMEFGIFLTILKDIAFRELVFNRLFTETFDLRPMHVSTLENNGFEFEGRLRQHIFLDDCFVDSLIHGCLKEHENVRR